MVALPEDVGGAGIERDRCKLAQRNVGISAICHGSDFDGPDRLQAVAVFGLKPHSDVELSIGFQERGGYRASQRRLHDRVDIAHVHAVPRRLLAIDADV